MIVNPASRMLSAISFGVFCRSAPSTSAIMRSRNVSPGFTVTFTRIQSDSTFVPPVTNGPARRAGDGALIHGRDALDDVAVGRNHLAGRHPDDVTLAKRQRRH